jgi:hypothetical protein
MSATIDYYNAVAGSLGLGPTSLGITLSHDEAVPVITSAATEPRLSWINIEGFVDPSAQNESISQLTSDLESYLASAKANVAGAGKQAFLTMQAYDRNGQWTNLNTLAALQEPVYFEAYNDPNVVGILMFDFNRSDPICSCGGTFYHADVLQQSHREMGSIMGLSRAMSVDTPRSGATVSQGFLIGGWAADLAATDNPNSSGHGTGVNFVVVWATPTNGNPPTYLGAAAYGGYRPDVGAVFGAQFSYSGFNLLAPAIPSGQYWLSVYPHSSISGTYMTPHVVLVTVQ